MSDYTTIQLSKKTKMKLDKMKVSNNESYNDIIEQLIEDTLDLSDETKTDIELALQQIKSGDTISHENVKKKLGL